MFSIQYFPLCYHYPHSLIQFYCINLPNINAILRKLINIWINMEWREVNASQGLRDERVQEYIRRRTLEQKMIRRKITHITSSPSHIPIEDSPNIWKVWVKEVEFGTSF